MRRRTRKHRLGMLVRAASASAALAVAALTAVSIWYDLSLTATHYQQRWMEATLGISRGTITLRASANALSCWAWPEQQVLGFDAAAHRLSSSWWASPGLDGLRFGRDVEYGTAGKWHELRCSSWILLLTIAAAACPPWIAWWRRRRPNGCPACGYDLADLPTTRCPECGRGVTP